VAARVAAIEMLRAIAAEIKIGSQCSSVVHTLSRVLRCVARSPDAERSWLARPMLAGGGSFLL
jgi:uncharacterized protein YerC